MEGQFIIINLETMDFFKDEEGNMKFYDTEYEAKTICSIYELPNAWILQLKHKHIENESN